MNSCEWCFETEAVKLLSCGHTICRKCRGDLWRLERGRCTLCWKSQSLPTRHPIEPLAQIKVLEVHLHYQNQKLAEWYAVALKIHNQNQDKIDYYNEEYDQYLKYLKMPANPFQKRKIKAYRNRLETFDTTLEQIPWASYYSETLLINRNYRSFHLQLTILIPQSKIVRIHPEGKYFIYYSGTTLGFRSLDSKIIHCRVFEDGLEDVCFANETILVCTDTELQMYNFQLEIIRRAPINVEIQVPDSSVHPNWKPLFICSDGQSIILSDKSSFQKYDLQFNLLIRRETYGNSFTGMIFGQDYLYVHNIHVLKMYNLDSLEFVNAYYSFDSHLTYESKENILIQSTDIRLTLYTKDYKKIYTGPRPNQSGYLFVDRYGMMYSITNWEIYLFR